MGSFLAVLFIKYPATPAKIETMMDRYEQVNDDYEKTPSGDKPHHAGYSVGGGWSGWIFKLENLVHRLNSAASDRGELWSKHHAETTDAFSRCIDIAAASFLSAKRCPFAWITPDGIWHEPTDPTLPAQDTWAESLKKFGSLQYDAVVLFCKHM